MRYSLDLFQKWTKKRKIITLKDYFAPISIELCAQYLIFLFGLLHSLIGQLNTTAGYYHCAFRNRAKRSQTVLPVLWQDGEETIVSNLEIIFFHKVLLVSGSWLNDAFVKWYYIWSRTFCALVKVLLMTDSSA